MADEPDLQFFGFSLWVDGRQFPNATDYWDGNWLTVRARMEAYGARVSCGGSILMTADIKKWRDELVVMASSLSGEASLTPLEPELSITFKMLNRGQLEAIVNITPDHLAQEHRFKAKADQSYLPAIIGACDTILEHFPVKSTPEAS